MRAIAKREGETSAARIEADVSTTSTTSVPRRSAVSVVLPQRGRASAAPRPRIERRTSNPVAAGKRPARTRPALAARAGDERGAPGRAPPDGEDESEGRQNREKEARDEQPGLGEERAERGHRGVTGKTKSAASPASARHAAAGRAASGKTSRKRVYFVVLISLFSSLSIVAKVSARP